MKNILYTKRILVAACCLLFTAYSHSQDGSLDLSFSTDGILTTPIGLDEDYARGIAIQTDGKIVVAGHAFNDESDVIAITRYNTDGSLDNTFDLDGIVTTLIGEDGGRAHAVAIQSDGKIVMAGHYSNGTDQDFVVVRYHSDGSLDNTFDTDGYASTGFGQFSNDRSFAVAIQSDGKIVAVGYNTNPEGNVNREFAVVRYNADGSADNTFDGDGALSTSIEVGGDEARSVIIQSDGKIVVGGFSFDSMTREFCMVRYNTDGSLDNTFDTDGIVTTSISAFDDAGYAIAKQSDGKFVLVGYRSGLSIGETYDFAMVRYNTDGSLDSSFDDDGIAITSFGTSATSADEAYSVAIQSDGKILVAGHADNYFAIVRYHTDGSLDNSFDSDGMVTTAIGGSGSEDLVYAMALQADGKIVVAGYSSNNDEYAFALARYHNMGISAIDMLDNQRTEAVVYPNPSNGTFQLKNIFPNSEITIYDSMGRMILTQRTNPLSEISIPENSTKGIYSVSIANCEIVEVLQLIVE
ncbi:MAG: T9SS type A sorting domain-containing protein [Flavobacteriales bacterium]